MHTSAVSEGEMDHFTTIVPLLSMVLNPDSQGGLDSRLHHHIRENRYASSIRNMHRSMNFEKKKNTAKAWECAILRPDTYSFAVS